MSRYLQKNHVNLSNFIEFFGNFRKFVVSARTATARPAHRTPPGRWLRRTRIPGRRPHRPKAPLETGRLRLASPPRRISSHTYGALPPARGEGTELYAHVRKTPSSQMRGNARSNAAHAELLKKPVCVPARPSNEERRVRHICPDPPWPPIGHICPDIGQARGPVPTRGGGQYRPRGIFSTASIREKSTCRGGRIRRERSTKDAHPVHEASIGIDLTRRMRDRHSIGR